MRRDNAGMTNNGTRLRRRTFVDLFAGCGGISLGLMQAGWRGLFAIEKDKFAFETLRFNDESQINSNFYWNYYCSPMNNHAVPNYKNSRPSVITLRIARHPDRTLGECIKKWRLEEGLLQKDLANMIGVNEMTIVNWEKGRNRPSKRSLRI